MRQRKLTDRQRHVLMFIKNYIHEKGYPPSMRDIGDSMGFSAKAACDHLRAIERKGYITSLPDRPRSLKIPKIHAIEVTENVENLGKVAVHALARGQQLFRSRGRLHPDR